MRLWHYNNICATLAADASLFGLQNDSTPVNVRPDCGTGHAPVAPGGDVTLLTLPKWLVGHFIKAPVSFLSQLPRQYQTSRPSLWQLPKRPVLFWVHAPRRLLRPRLTRVDVMSSMTSWKAAVSSACRWLCRAIFSLNFRGLQVPEAAPGLGPGLQPPVPIPAADIFTRLWKSSKVERLRRRTRKWTSPYATTLGFVVL